MTKPTGRPKGRPKTKEYTTLMARVPQDLADQARHYAGRMQQTMSDVLRDGLLLLLDQDQAQAPLFVYDRKEAQSTMLSDTQEGSTDIMSDRKRAATWNASHPQREPLTLHAVTPRRAPAVKVSDTKRDRATIMSDTKVAGPAMVSDTKEVQTASPPAIMSDTNIPAFDSRKFSLGKLCPRGHDYHGTGQSLLRLPRHVCRQCDNEQKRDRRQAKRQTQPA
jgi:hypothetical protein